MSGDSAGSDARCYTLHTLAVVLTVELVDVDDVVVDGHAHRH